MDRIEVWTHDLYVESQQGPRSREEKEKVSSELVVMQNINLLSTFNSLCVAGNFSVVKTLLRRFSMPALYCMCSGKPRLDFHGGQLAHENKKGLPLKNYPLYGTQGCAQSGRWWWLVLTTS